jgi:hypothetical protein
MVRSLYIVGVFASLLSCGLGTATPGMPMADVVIDSFSCTNAVLGESAECTLKASSRNGTPICRLEFDGQTLQVGPCNTEQKVRIVITRAGMISVLLTATAGNGSATRAVTVNVTSVTNRAPVIARFVAVNPMGPAPHRPQLEFSVSDPEGDAMTCDIDVNADGTDDLTVPCASGRADITLNQPGNILIRLAVTDSKDALAVADLTVTVTAPGGMGGGGAGGSGAGGAGGRGGSGVGGAGMGGAGMGGSGGRGGAGGSGMGGGGGRGGAGMGGAGMGGAGMGGAGMGGAGMGGAGGGVVNPNEPIEVRPVAVHWGQTVITPTLKLVTSKATQVRVWVVSEGTAQPTALEVVAEVRQNGAAVGSVTLTPPTRIPTTATVGAANAGWYVGTIPAAQVQPNMEVVVRVDPSNAVRERDEGNNQLSVRPTVGRANQLNVTNVPIENGGRTGVPPASLGAYVQERWPLASVDQRTRAPFSFSGTIGANAGWSQLLSSVGQAKMNDNSRRNYYGWVKVNYGSGIAGIGNIGSGTSAGRDDSLDTAAHEFGHNFGRNHAPCGVSGDAQYPYPNAAIGVWGVDSAGMLKDPARLKDLMSYCDPTWISDYTYAGAQSFLERGTQFTPGVALAHVVTNTNEGLLLGALVRHSEVMWQPTHRVARVPTPTTLDDTSTFFVLTFADGSTRSVQGEVLTVADEDAYSVLAAVAESRSPVSISLVRNGTAISEVVAAKRPVSTETRVRVVGQRVEVDWPVEWAFAAVTHIAADGERTTLTLDGRDGHVSLGLGPLVGGHFEVSLSNGLDAVLTQK